VATVAHVKIAVTAVVVETIAADAVTIVVAVAMIVVVVVTIVVDAVKTTTVANQTVDHVHLNQLQTMQCRSASKTNSTANSTVTNKP
jgi:hypothetical protein